MDANLNRSNSLLRNAKCSRIGRARAAQTPPRSKRQAGGMLAASANRNKSSPLTIGNIFRESHVILRNQIAVNYENKGKSKDIELEILSTGLEG